MTAPNFSPRIYQDNINLYLEFDNFVLTFPFTEGGMGKALKHVPNVASQPGYFSGKGGNILSLVKKPKLPKTKLGRGVAISESQAEALNSILDVLEDKK